MSTSYPPQPQSPWPLHPGPSTGGRHSVSESWGLRSHFSAFTGPLNPTPSPLEGGPPQPASPYGRDRKRGHSCICPSVSAHLRRGQKCLRSEVCLASERKGESDEKNLLSILEEKAISPWPGFPTLLRPFSAGVL